MHSATQVMVGGAVAEALLKSIGGKMVKNLRLLIDVSEDELQKAVVKTCEELGIAGSATHYSLFQAVFNERKSALGRKKRLEEAMVHYD